MVQHKNVNGNVILITERMYDICNITQLLFEALYTFLLVFSCFYERKNVFTPVKDRGDVYVVCVFVSLTAERGYENSHSSRHRSIAGDLAASCPGAAVKRQAEIYSALWDITQPRGHLATSSKLTCYCVLPAKPEHPLNAQTSHTPIPLDHIQRG